MAFASSLFGPEFVEVRQAGLRNSMEGVREAARVGDVS